MQQFDWTFPACSSTGSDRDVALQGFQSFLAGVTRLSVITQQLEQAATEEYVAYVTQELAELWPNVLRFLASMRKERHHNALQIKFVVLKLSESLPSFRAAAEEAEVDFRDLSPAKQRSAT